MRITIEIRRPRWMGSVWLRRARPLVLFLTLALASPVLASHPPFTDVPDSNPHHDDIEAIRAAGITQGCNPPDNTLYCPEQFVRRDQMGSFLARTAGLGANPPVANADKLDGLDSSAFQPAGDYTVMQLGPWHVRGTDAATIGYFVNSNDVVSASPGGRAVQLALDGPAAVGGIGYGFASARICFLASANVTIDNTNVYQGTDTDWLELVLNTTDRPMASNACYTVSDTTPTAAVGGTTLQLDLQYAAAATAVLGSVTTTWTPVSP